MSKGFRIILSILISFVVAIGFTMILNGVLMSRYLPAECAQLGAKTGYLGMISPEAMKKKEEYCRPYTKPIEYVSWGIFFTIFTVCTIVLIRKVSKRK